MESTLQFYFGSAASKQRRKELLLFLSRERECFPTCTRKYLNLKLRSNLSKSSCFIFQSKPESASRRELEFVLNVHLIESRNVELIFLLLCLDNSEPCCCLTKLTVRDISSLERLTVFPYFFFLNGSKPL